MKTVSIQKLSIQNFATFENQEIEFHPRLNTIIGETGSGKSLILDALHLLFGGRASKSIVRKEAKCAVVEAVLSFSDEKIEKYLSELGFPCDEQEIFLKRVLYPNGKSKSFLNFQSCRLSDLQIVSRQYIDLVGQFENQKLLKPQYQLMLIDRSIPSNKNLQKYKNLFSQLVQFEKDLATLIEESVLIKEQEDYLKFQFDQLSQLTPTKEREDQLSKKKQEVKNLLENTKSLTSASNDLQLIQSKIHSVASTLKEVFKDSEPLSKIEALKLQFEDCYFDLSKDLSDSLDIQQSTNQLEKIEDELNLYQVLKRKFNTDTPGLSSLRKEIEEKLSSISSTELRISSLEQSVRELKTKAYETAQKIHNERKKVAKVLGKRLTENVQRLNMKGSQIQFRFDLSEQLSQSGLSEVELMAELNPGEGQFPVRKTASGGELSRILLSLRKSLMGQDSISVFLFDEIDSGIGGETATRIGEDLSSISKNSQVIAITHLPQISQFSDKMIVIGKSFDTNRTYSKILLETEDKDSILAHLNKVNSLSCSTQTGL